MKDLTFVSVIIPCFNSEKYLAETLDSVLAQTHAALEIICVDNGSTDGTRDLITRFSERDKRITLLNEPTAGASYARNKGLKVSKGEFVQFLDSDDIIASQKIEKQLSVAREHNADIVVSDRIIKNENLTREIQRLSYSEVESNPITTAISEIIITGNPLYKKSIVDDVGGYTAELKMAQDWDFHIKLFLRKPKIKYLKGTFLTSRTVSDSLSSNWLRVSYYGTIVLNNYNDLLVDSDIHKDDKCFLKIARVYLDTAIHTNEPQIISNCLQQIEVWNVKRNLKESLGGFNRLICSLLGIKRYISFKRLFSSKQELA